MNSRLKFHAHVTGFSNNVLDVRPIAPLFGFGSDDNTNFIQPRDIQDLMKFLNEKPEITGLDLTGCKLGDEIVDAMLINNTVKHISIGGNNLTIAGIKKLVKSKTLEVIDFSFSELTHEEIKAILNESTSNHAIQRIGLQCCKLGDAEAYLIYRELLKRNVSFEIDLIGNSITINGALALAFVRNEENTCMVRLVPQNGAGLEGSNVLTGNQWHEVREKTYEFNSPEKFALYRRDRQNNLFRSAMQFTISQRWRLFDKDQALTEDDIRCPFTMEIFLEPVKMPLSYDETGEVDKTVTVEKQFIENWINKSNGENPYTRKKLTVSELIDDKEMKQKVSRYLSANPAKTEEQFNPNECQASDQRNFRR